jgi:alkanesulfonate monooxygenase SsuD/methylene tetrahydromethanopterin reductase-like flavin-dependent oxidoreductase (luciferase family)
VEFKGDYFEYTGGKLINPRCVQEPHPPVIVGVNIPGRALDIAVREADEINTWQLGADAVSALADEATGRCKAAGRAPLRITSDVLFLRGADEQAAAQLVEGIQTGARAGGRHVEATEWNTGGVLFGDAAQVVEQAGKFKAAGVEELTVSLSSVEDMNWFASEILPGI